jgi:hypothetical protein
MLGAMETVAPIIVTLLMRIIGKRFESSQKLVLLLLHELLL